MKIKAVTIIIVTYNGMPWLKRCLDSCMDYPVIVVDNASTDGTIDYITKNYPQVTLLPQNKNLGFGQANNLGIAYALNKAAERVFLLNQDAYLQQDCIKNLIEVQQRNPQFGILSPIHLNGNGDRLDRNFSHYMRYDRNPDFYSDYILGKPFQVIYDVPFVNAAGWLMSRDILNTVGGFDPIFFHYGEDENYCHRATYHNYKIGVVPNVFLNHDREDREVPNVKRGSPKYFELMERNLKKKFADINLETQTEIEALIFKRTKSRNRAYAKLDFATAEYLKNEVSLLKKIKPQIYKSVVQNRTSGKNHLPNKD